MPHKHKRKPNAAGDYDLPPSARAAPLSVGKAPAFSSTKPGSKKRKRDANKDDTPRAFTRLLEAQKGLKRPSGLDNGDAPPSKKKKRRQSKSTASDPTNATSTRQAETQDDELKIRPGERMSDFSARVNQALPISGLTRRTQKIEGMKEPQTRTEKKIQRKIAAWRVEEARRQEAAEDEADERDLEDAADLNVSEGAGIEREARKSKSKAEDPWARLKRERGQRARVGDVALAPPELVKVKPKFKVRDGARVDVDSVPSKAGSLRKREELGGERKGVIEAYRALMAERRG